MESNVADQLTELCRYTLKHSLRTGTAKLLFFQLKHNLQGTIFHSVHLKHTSNKQNIHWLINRFKLLQQTV